MKRFLLFLTAVVLTGISFSCTEEGPQKDDIVKFSATINSQQTVPRATSTAQGTGVFEYSKSTKKLKYNITYQNVVPTSITLNVGSPNWWDAGPIVFTLASNPTGSQVQGEVSQALTDEQQTWLITGVTYINIPSATNIYGEARGRILANSDN